MRVNPFVDSHFAHAQGRNTANGTGICTGQGGGGLKKCERWRGGWSTNMWGLGRVNEWVVKTIVFT